MTIPKLYTDFFSECGIHDLSNFIARITQYKNYLSEENKKHNLTRIESDKDFWNKHICDSISILKFFPHLIEKKINIIDIGCGAGFPSFVLAAAFQNLNITAIDSVGKKTNFLNKASALTNLDNLIALHTRSNEYKTEEKFDIITARAVGDIFKIFKESRKLLSGNGKYILYKTPEGIDEDLERVNKFSAKFNFIWKKTEYFTLPGGNGERLFVVGEKTNA